MHEKIETFLCYFFQSVLIVYPQEISDLLPKCVTGPHRHHCPFPCFSAEIQLPAQGPSCAETILDNVSNFLVTICHWCMQTPLDAALSRRIWHLPA
jgi:hypothetical protein